MYYTAVPLALNTNRAYNCRKAKVAPPMLLRAIVVYIARALRNLIFVTVSLQTV